VYLSLKSWTVYLIVWITGARCKVSEMAHSSGRVGTKMTPNTVAARCFTCFKYLLRLALITISYFFFLSHLGFTFLALRLRIIEDKRGTKRPRSPSKEGSTSPSSAPTPPSTPSRSPSLLGSSSETSCCPRLPMFDWGGGGPTGRLQS
jgi:hypothetical protein